MDAEQQQLEAAVDQAAAEVIRAQQAADQAQQRQPRNQEEVNDRLRELRTATQAHLNAIRTMRTTMEGWNRNLQTALRMVKARGGRPEQ